MPPLARYKPSEVRLDSGQAKSVLAQQQSQGWSNLSSKLEQFRGIAFQEAGKARAVEAENQAVKDELSDKPFHKESVYTIYGQAYNNKRKATYLANTEVDINNKSKELATKYEDDPQGYANEFNAYLDTTKRETGIADVEMAIGLSGKKLFNNTYEKLNYNVQQKEKQTQLAQFEEYAGLKSAELINAISKGDTKSADLIRVGLDEYTTSLMEDNTLSDAKFIKYTSDFEYEVKKGVISNQIEDLVDSKNIKQAGQIVKKFNEEIPPGFTPKQYESIKADINNTYNKAVKQQEAAYKKYISGQKKKLNLGSKIFDLGATPKNIGELDRIAATLSDEDRYEYELSKVVYQKLSQYSNLSLPEQQNIVNSLESSEEKDLPTIQMIGKMKSILKEKESMIKTDPISLSIQDGTNKPTNTITANMSTEDLSKELTIREDMADTNKLNYGTNANYLLTEAEAKEYGDILENPNTSIETIMNTIETIETTIPESSNAVYNQLNSKGAKTFSYVGGLIKSGNKPKAYKVLKGKVIRKEIKGSILEKDIMTEVNSALGNALMYSGKGQREATMDAVLNYSAAIAEETGTLGEYDNGKKSLTDILGNIGEKKGQNYILPPNKDEGDVEDYIDDLTSDTFTKEFRGMTKDQAIKTIQNGQLISVGIGKYRVKYNNGFLATDDNKPFVLEIK